MPIIVNVDIMLAKRKMTSAELAQEVGITPVNLSILKTGKAKAVRFSTLSALCRHLIASLETFWNTGPVKRKMKNKRSSI